MTESEDSGFAPPHAVRARGQHEPSGTSTGAADDLVGQSSLKRKPSDPGFNFPNFDAPLFTQARCVDFMTCALEAPQSFDCVPNAHPIRKRFYQARRCCQTRDDRRFDSLTFQIEGFWLSIFKCPIGTPRRYRGELWRFGEMRYCINQHGITRQDL